MSKPDFRPIAPLDVADADLDHINDRLGVPTMVRPTVTTPSRRDSVAASRRAAMPSPQQKLTIRIPATLNDTMKRNALDRRTTVRHIVLSALKAAGYEVSDADLAPGAGGNC